LKPIKLARAVAAPTSKAFREGRDFALAAGYKPTGHKGPRGQWFGRTLADGFSVEFFWVAGECVAATAQGVAA
jgi:hypothetical protein